jgi:HK97 family phage major capsid protein
MKKLFANRTFRICLGLVVTVLLFVAGHKEAAAGAPFMAEAAVLTVDDPELSEADKKVVGAIKKQFDQALLDARKGLMTAEEFKAQVEEFRKGLKEKEFKELNEILLAQGIDINKIKEGASGGSAAGPDLRKEIKKQLLAKAADIKAIAEKGNGVINLDLVNKAAELVDTGNFGTGVIRGLRETEVDRRQMRERSVMNIITIINGGKDSDPLSWLERRPKEGGAAFITEGTAKPYVDHTWTEGKASAEFIAVATPVSRKALTVMSMLENEINDILNEELMDALEEYILRNAGGSVLVNSVWSYAKAFTGASLATSVEGANEFDVLRAAILQARKGNPSDAKHSGRMPNRIYISLDIQAKMDLLKDAEGRYLLPPFMTPDGTRIGGVEVVGTEFLGDDEFLVGDFTRYAFNIVSPQDVQVGYINDQFIKNELMIRAELMGNGRIKYHDTWSFVRGTFTAAKAALETV